MDKYEGVFLAIFRSYTQEISFICTHYVYIDRIMEWESCKNGCLFALFVSKREEKGEKIKKRHAKEAPYEAVSSAGT